MIEMISTGGEPGFGDKGACPKGVFVVVEEVNNDINDFWTDGSTIGT
jgi:hypothetical protein